MKNMALQLMAGIEIPFPQLGLSVRQPTIKEISFIGEESFFMGCELLTFSKKRMTHKEQIELQKYSDFQVLTSILMNNNKDILKDNERALLVLMLLFPGFMPTVEFEKIILTNQDDETIVHEINEQNYEIFKDIISTIFCLNKMSQDNYNAGSKKAQELIDKFKKSRQKINKQKGRSEELDILGRYISVLAIGLQVDVNTLLNYTVYQLYNQFDRFILKNSYDIYLMAKTSFGGSSMEEPDNWMGELNQTSNKKDELRTIRA